MNTLNAMLVNPRPMSELPDVPEQVVFVRFGRDCLMGKKYAITTRTVRTLRRKDTPDILNPYHPTRRQEPYINDFNAWSYQATTVAVSLDHSEISENNT